MGLKEILGEVPSLTPAQLAHIQAMRVRKRQAEQEERAVLTGPFGSLYHTCTPFDRQAQWPGDCTPCLVTVDAIMARVGDVSC